MNAQLISNISVRAATWRRRAPQRPGTARELAVQLASPSDLLARALRENSNRESDWLWYAGRLTNMDEQRYCLLRALEIDPASGLARHELVRLDLQSAHPGVSRWLLSGIFKLLGEPS